MRHSPSIRWYVSAYSPSNSSGFGSGLDAVSKINQVATPLRGIGPGQLDPVVGDRMQKRITALVVAIEEFEGTIEATADGIYTRHFADRNLHPPHLPRTLRQGRR